jgi:hypothetical protein
MATTVEAPRTDAATEEVLSGKVSGFNAQNGSITVLNQTVSVRQSMKVKRSLLPSELRKDEPSLTVVRDQLVQTIAQAARALASITEGKPGKVGTGVRLVGGGDTVAANLQAMKQFKDGLL